MSEDLIIVQNLDLCDSWTVTLDKKGRGANLKYKPFVFTLVSLSTKPPSWFYRDPKAGCRYLTVDAYLDAEEFYAKCDFNPLVFPELGDETVLMFFDLMGIA